MAPSQHVRSKLGSTLAIILGATLALSACGTQQAGTAAIVDGTTISNQEVQTAANQLNTLAPAQKKISPTLVLFYLIIGPYVLAEAKSTGKVVSDAEARQEMAKMAQTARVAALADPSPVTVGFVRSFATLQTLSPASRTAILARVGKVKVTVNPRYGTFDTKQVALLPTSPNWIKASTSPGAK